MPVTVAETTNGEAKVLTCESKYASVMPFGVSLGLPAAPDGQGQGDPWRAYKLSSSTRNFLVYEMDVQAKSRKKYARIQEPEIALTFLVYEIGLFIALANGPFLVIFSHYLGECGGRRSLCFMSLFHINNNTEDLVHATFSFTIVKAAAAFCSILLRPSRLALPGFFFRAHLFSLYVFSGSSSLSKGEIL